jgi:MFS family permease
MTRTTALSDVSLPSAKPHLNRGQWLVLAAAFLGWMFDGMEMGLSPIAARSALIDLMHLGSHGAALEPAAEAIVGQWHSYVVALFLVGAACGGVLFGSLGDRIGRVRAMALSILTYSLFTGCCYFAQTPWQLGLLLFLAALGMGGQWPLGVALVVECLPDRLRPFLAGAMGAIGNVGYLVIALLAMSFGVTPASWRWTMLIGAVPAILALGVVAMIPESQRWKDARKKQAHASPVREVLTPPLLWPTLLGIALASIALIGTWGTVSGFLPAWGRALTPQNPHAEGTVQCMTSIGAILGCLCLSWTGRRIGRRITYFGLCAVALLVCGFLFGTGAWHVEILREHHRLFLATCLLAGCATGAFYGWFPLYLPELFPTRVRATAQGMCYNTGRVFAAGGVLGKGQLMQFFHGSHPHACVTITLVYLIGMVLIWFAPETKGKPLPD